MARRRPPTVHGLAIIDKPAGVTSHDVVNQMRKLLGERRIGHAGTLDPDATGVLLVGVGYVTRLMQFLSGMDKTYEAEVVFGIETNTLDSAGEVTARHDMAGITIEQIQLAAAKLTGEILQIPPMVSAIRVDGKRLHELAREGIEIERKERPVTVHSFDVQPTDDPLVVRIVVNVSSGTYVRTLAADLGTLLGGGALTCRRWWTPRDRQTCCARTTRRAGSPAGSRSPTLCSWSQAGGCTPSARSPSGSEA